MGDCLDIGGKFPPLLWTTGETMAAFSCVNGWLSMISEIAAWSVPLMVPPEMYSIGNAIVIGSEAQVIKYTVRCAYDTV